MLSMNHKTIKFQAFCNYETISYVICGVLTTLVNWGVFRLCRDASFGTFFSTVAAWILAVIFAFFTNKIFVFKSKTFHLSTIMKEMIPFFICCLLSGIFDVIFMIGAVDFVVINDNLSKLISNFFVMVANYFASKLLIFNTKKNKTNEIPNCETKNNNSNYEIERMEVESYEG